MAELEKLLTSEEVAELLGVAVGTLGVWRSTRAYDLPFVKIGYKPMYRPSVVAAFMESREQAGIGARKKLSGTRAPRPEPKPKQSGSKPKAKAKKGA